LTSRLEQRVNKVEEKFPQLDDGFTASIDNVEPPLAPDDPRLKAEIEAFTCTIHGSGKKEERGKAFISPWFEVLFIGGRLKAWKKKLQEMRENPEYFDPGRKATEWLSFKADGTEPDGPRLSGFVIEHSRSNSLCPTCGSPLHKEHGSNEQT